MHLVTLGIAAIILASHAGPAGAAQLIGGPCSYEEFPGTCAATADEGAAQFTYEGKVRGRDAKLSGNPAGDKIAAGTKVPCKLMFIKSGTCTPCLFSIGECGKETWELFRTSGRQY